MADNDTANGLGRPMGDADITPPQDASFTPAVPLKDAGVEFQAEGGGGSAGASGSSGVAGATGALKNATGKLGTQASDKVREFAEMGKERAGGALDQLVQMLNDAAGQVDGKLGAQYGQYARTAADQVQSFSQSVRDKDIDELMTDARELVRKSPGIAIGAAATLGFVIARVVQAGIDAERA